METPAARRHREGVPATLNKPVAALAIVPLNRSLTVTARKAYNVMLHLAQREGDTGDAGFSAPLNAILRGFGVGNNVATDAKRYIDQMTSTKIEWRPLAEGEQWQLGGEPGLPLGVAAASTPAPPAGLEPRSSVAAQARDELRIFNMLAEVRLYKKGGENWVTWFYPPTIKEQMLGPRRWARLELEVIARLATYTAVALYEICARYRDNPGGVTSRHPWQWWVPVLKGSEAGKQREWRKFKNEFVNPAIREINAVSDIEIELLEYKQGRAIADVQFGVRKKAAPSWTQAPEVPDATQVLRALRLGLREADADALLERWGDAAMATALDTLERSMARADGGLAKPILNKAAYLKTILSGQAAARADAAEGEPPRPALSLVGVTPPGHAPATAAPMLPPPAREAGQPRGGSPFAAPPAMPARVQALTAVGEELRTRRQAEAREAFEALPAAEQAGWTRRLRDHLAEQGGGSPVVLRRLDAGQWQSPLVKAMMIRYWAQQVFGEDWLQGR